MKKLIQKSEFENIVLLIEEARNRAYSKVNEELVLLYFNVGNIVSSKVAEGIWGEGTVDELAGFIALKIPSLTSFNRRGLYRMKQFYETYSADSDCFKLWNGIKEQSLNVSPVATQMTPEKADNLNVSPAATHLQNIDKQYDKFISSLLIQISWTGSPT